MGLRKNPNNMEQKIFIKTFGCQMNEYDSNRIFESVKKIGYQKVNNQEEANCYLINTCHIRDKAKEKVYHEVGRVKKIFRSKKREPYVDLVVGPQSYHKINDMILNYVQSKKKNEDTEFDAISKFKYFSKIKNNSEKVSSFLTIQEGCDKFCHFCVVPYTRGPEYSRPFKQILDEAKYLVDHGVKELILLGQNVNAYKYEGKRLSNLLLEIEKLSGIERIRYTTSHPKDMTEDLIEVYRFTKKLMPLVHLPVQSGSDRILNLMNRKHTIDDYMEIFEKLKKINPNVFFSSDFIIGYPGEKEQDFKNTLDLIKKINFINSYSFIFSPRPGTVAANLELTDRKISMERLEIIQSQLFKNQIKFNRSLENKTLNVLVENLTEDKNQAFGRSEYMTSVIFNGKKNDIGKTVKVKIKQSNRTTLYGDLVKNSNKKVA
jgi:tRNA-2-methylthio-N6-dimethylallyladenosine synthase